MSQPAVARSPPSSLAMLHQPCFWLSNLVNKGAVVPPVAEQQSSEAVRTTTYSHKHCSRRQWYEDGLWGWSGRGVQSNRRRRPPLPCRSVNLMHLATAVGAGLQTGDALDARSGRSRRSRSKISD